MSKELFNQDLKTTLGTSDRIAIGVPGQEGCDNMLVSIFKELLQGSNISTGTISNGDLTTNVWTYSHSKSTRNVEIIVYDGDGYLIEISGMMRVTGIDSIEIDFGGEIFGTWTYIFKWYNI